MFKWFRRKELTHEEKLSQAYSCYKSEVVDKVFPKGMLQADIIIRSIARIINVDLTKCSSLQYYDILSTYSLVLIKVVVTNSSDDAIISALQEKHNSIIHSKDIARRVMEYCIANIKDNCFGLSLDEDCNQVEYLVDRRDVSTSSPMTILLATTFNEIHDTLKQTQVYNEEARFEIVPLLMVLADYIAACERKDREAIYQETQKWAKDILSGMRSTAWVDKRMDFYGKIIRDKHVRGEWACGTIDEYLHNPILRCVVAFGDVVVNPNCGEDYESAPIVLRDFSQMLSFEFAMKGAIVKIVAAFCDKIASIIGGKTMGVFESVLGKSPVKKASKDAFGNLVEVYGRETEKVIKYWALLYYAKKKIETSSLQSGVRNGLMQALEHKEGKEMLEKVLNVESIVDEEELAKELDIINQIENDTTGRFQWV